MIYRFLLSISFILSICSVLYFGEVEQGSTMMHALEIFVIAFMGICQYGLHSMSRRIEQTEMGLLEIRIEMSKTSSPIDFKEKVTKPVTSN